MSSFLEGRIPLSRINEFGDITQNLKRSIIISHKKLPQDFFPSKASPTRELSIQNPRNIILSQKMNRNFSTHENTPRYLKRPSMTAREGRIDKDEDLIMGIISASYEMKRVIRKHSIELRRSEKEILSISPEKATKIHWEKKVELPPLLMKKSLTSNQ